MQHCRADDRLGPTHRGAVNEPDEATATTMTSSHEQCTPLVPSLPSVYLLPSLSQPIVMEMCSAGRCWSRAERVDSES